MPSELVHGTELLAEFRPPLAPATRARARPARTSAFWLRELRTPALLIEFARSAADVAPPVAVIRPLLNHAIAGDIAAVAAALRDEQEQEQEADHVYWAPLRAELEALRRARR